MKKEDILKAFGNIKDEYTDEEAAAVSKNRKTRRPWVKWSGAVAALLVVAFIGVSLGGGFSGLRQGTKEAAEPAAPQNGGIPADKADNSSSHNYDFSGLPSYGHYDSINDGSSDTSQLAYSPDKVKLIYKADISAQTTDFAKSKGDLQNLVEQLGGYFENQSISNGTFYADKYLKIGKFTVRIPSEKYRTFLDGVGEGITITSLYESVDDVGLAYSEVEQRLETYNIKLDRLQKLLAEAKEMPDIITLEDAISETEFLINEYQKDINRYDSLIGYSTISINLNEVARPDSGIQKKEGFFHKFGRMFADGLENAGDNIAEFFYWVSYNFVGIVVFAAVVVLLYKFRPITKLIRKLRRK